MSIDEICLTLPADDAFHGVAHLVLGGLAVRLDLTFEHLEDLELALDALLDRPSAGDELTVRVLVADGELRTIVGPFTSLRAEYEDARWRRRPEPAPHPERGLRCSRDRGS